MTADHIRPGQLLVCGHRVYKVLHAWTSGPTTRLYAEQQDSRRKVELRLNRDEYVLAEDVTTIDLARGGHITVELVTRRTPDTNAVYRYGIHGDHEGDFELSPQWKSSSEAACQYVLNDLLTAGMAWHAYLGGQCDAYDHHTPAAVARWAADILPELDTALESIIGKHPATITLPEQSMAG
jgi:hypothetical protein